MDMDNGKWSWNTTMAIDPPYESGSLEDVLRHWVEQTKKEVDKSGSRNEYGDWRYANEDCLSDPEGVFISFHFDWHESRFNGEEWLTGLDVEPYFVDGECTGPASFEELLVAFEKLFEVARREARRS